MWKDGNNNYLKYRQYDAAPLAPANYSVSAYQSGTNYYPKLTWQLNNEPDVRNKSSNAYKIERRTRLLNGIWSSWSLLANLSGTTSAYIDYSIGNASGGDREAEYRLTAIDIGNNSSPSQSVVIDYGFDRAEKTVVNGIVREYSINQNYPNPFNPSTKISYSIKEEGLVTLKVYDVLGKEVATLVNENKAVGNYEVDFNASHLSSGIYYYKIIA
ncbi:MAG: T9SS type A sorting domain-containing protein, partial [Brumimicrobium sp.]|nr:T9SS type A sorting domain-containing protein [Brumimicrobium sp.]